MRFFRKIKKAIKFLIKHKIDVPCIYIENLDKKKNNNDILLKGFLDIEFGEDGRKYEKIISYTCDFLSGENGLNNMCDFRDNKCLSCRERKIERAIGCCQKNCKFVHAGVCNVKNVACKLYMCDYVENRGFYFSPYHQPLLKKYLMFSEILACRCMLFKSLDFEVKTLKITKFSTICMAMLVITLIVLRITLAIL